MTTGRITYNPALDGVRALAVVAVIWYHADVVGGGWLGVEVFFVLSGYLITAILIVERDRSDRIDLVDFWRRRARRLLPGIGLLVLLVAAYVWWWPGVEAGQSLDNDLFGLLTYTSNWTTLAGDGYWQQFDDPSPLRHAWSLAVEEQFYILYPLIAIVVLRSARRHWWLLGLATTALAWQVTASQWFSVERVYLGTDTRAFGLLAGAALAAWLVHRPIRARLPGSIGLVVLAVLTVVLGQATSSTFLGPFQLVVVASLIIVLDVATNTGGAAHRLLAVEPLRRVGRWSYGIYLFHWPILLAVDSQWAPSPVALAVIVTAVTIPLAALSYRLIEGPIRAGALTQLPSPTRWLAPAGAMTAVGVVAVVVAASASDNAATAEAVAGREIAVNAPATTTIPGVTTGPPAASSTTTSPTPSTTATSAPAAAPSTTTTPPTSPLTSPPTITPTTATPEVALLSVPRPTDRPLRVYVVGDSLGDSIGTALSDSAGDLGVEVFTRAAGGCGFDRERMQYFNQDFEPTACRDLVAAWRPDVLAYQPDVVLVAYAGWWGWYRDGRVQTQCEPELADHVRGLYDLALDDLHASGAPVYFVSPANWEGDPVGPDGIPALFDCVRSLMTDWVDANAPAARLVDVAGMLCSGDRCDATIDGEPVRPDRIHFGGATAPAMMTLILDDITDPPPGGWIHTAEITKPS